MLAEEIDPRRGVLHVVEDLVPPLVVLPVVEKEENFGVENVVAVEEIVRLREARLDIATEEINAGMPPMKLAEPPKGSSEERETANCMEDRAGKKAILPTGNFDLILLPTNAARRQIDPTLRMLLGK